MSASAGTEGAMSVRVQLDADGVTAVSVSPEKIGRPRRRWAARANFPGVQG
jgi:hypothetical protein